MPELAKAILKWVQTPLGATVVGGMVVLILWYSVLGQGGLDSMGQQVAIERSRFEGVTIFAPGGQVTINVYVDGLPESKDARKKALFEEGRSLQKKNEHAKAIQSFRAALALDNSQSEKAALLILIGNSFYLQSRLPEAEGSYREALASARAGGDREGEAAALGNLGIVYSQQGELDKALEHHQAALGISRQIGYRLGEAATLGNMGIVHRQKGELGKALEHFQGALKIDREIGHRRGEASQLGNLGNVYRQKGELDRALEHYQAALEIFRAIGARPEVLQTEENIAQLKARK